MISSQRVIAMMIAIHIIIGLVGAFDNGNYTDDEIAVQAGIELNRTEDLEHMYSSDEMLEGSIPSEGDLEENTIGDPIIMSVSVWNVLWNGLNPFSVNPWDYNRPMEQYVAFGIMVMRSLIITLVGLEIFLLLKNKKTS